VPNIKLLGDSTQFLSRKEIIELIRNKQIKTVLNGDDIHPNISSDSPRIEPSSFEVTTSLIVYELPKGVSVVGSDRYSLQQIERFVRTHGGKLVKPDNEDCFSFSHEKNYFMVSNESFDLYKLRALFSGKSSLARSGVLTQVVTGYNKEFNITGLNHQGPVGVLTNFFFDTRMKVNQPIAQLRLFENKGKLRALSEDALDQINKYEGLFFNRYGELETDRERLSENAVHCGIDFSGETLGFLAKDPKKAGVLDLTKKNANQASEFYDVLEIPRNGTQAHVPKGKMAIVNTDIAIRTPLNMSSYIKAEPGRYGYFITCLANFINPGDGLDGGDPMAFEIIPYTDLALDSNRPYCLIEYFYNKSSVPETWFKEKFQSCLPAFDYKFNQRKRGSLGGVKLPAFFRG
jgi:deoxycytidine triphosphate deaminase